MTYHEIEEFIKENAEDDDFTGGISEEKIKEIGLVYLPRKFHRSHIYLKTTYNSREVLHLNDFVSLE
jgi:hypothetical protein